MGILDKVFKKSENTPKENKINWIALTSIEQLDLIIGSTEKTSLLFKDSTRCGISASVLRKFENKNEEFDGKLDFYYLDLLNYRDVSNAIADKLEVLHQSPQAVIIKGGKVLTYESHYDIVNIELEQYL